MSFKNLIWKCFLRFLIFLLCLFSLFSYRYFYDPNQLEPDDFDQSTTIYPYLAVIIDDRKSEKVVDSVLNALQHIPSDWKVQMFTHPENWPYYKRSGLGPYIKIKRIFMTPLNFTPIHITTQFTNAYLTSLSLWRRVRGNKVLYFQYDSRICSNSSYKLQDFLRYDYIGAPWIGKACCNGGFSIRNRTKILELLEKHPNPYKRSVINEDGWYASNLASIGAIVARGPEAMKFSVETVYHPRPFGVHRPNVHYLGRENMLRICNECPETRSISNCSI